jgi:hypothetical protein
MDSVVCWVTNILVCVCACVRSDNISRVWWTCDCLRPFIWRRVSGLMRLRDGPDKGTSTNFVQISQKVRRSPWQLLDKRSEKKAWAVQGKSKLTETEKASKVKSMLIIFFDIKGIVHKEFALAGQTVNSGHYCDVLRRLHGNLRRLRQELWRQKN